ncbi:MAG: 5-formyltetrahydrofolate cyclo-ligase [Lachnospiraceae bacterium]|nr:5-formyltetrahydrofolate cyclo-ligase [Lachnospiraceae bacterium]
MKKKASKAEQKKKIRSIYLKRRNNLETDKKTAADKRIREKLYTIKRFRQAKTVFVYASYKSEVDTGELIRDALKMGKKVAVPKVDGQEMEFYEISSWEELFPGYQGILEPQSIDKKPVYPVDSDIMLVPGAVFDRRGGRIGYGGGYYDRYLDRVVEKYGHKPFLLALGYQVQLYHGTLPLENHDRKMDGILTEKSVIKPTQETGKAGWIVDILEVVIEIVIELIAELLD